MTDINEIPSSPQPSPARGVGAHTASASYSTSQRRGQGGGWNFLFFKNMVKPLLFLFIAISLPACGKRGALIPPEALAPAPINDLQVAQKGESFFLSWKAPSEDAAGRPLQDLAGFRLFSREVRPAGEDCEECPNAYRLRADLDVEFLTGAFRYDDLYFFIDQDIPPDLTRQYMIISYKRDHMASAPSNKVRRVKKPAPAPPQLTATPTPTAIQLQWQQVDVQPNSLLGYNLYRKSADEGYFPPLPVNEKPLNETQYEDIGLDRKAVYTYAVRTVATIDNEVVEGALSNEATASLIPIK